MRRWNSRVNYFLFLASLSFASSILKYSSTSSSGVSSFFFDVLGVLFLAASYMVQKGFLHPNLGLRKVVLDSFLLEGLLCMAHNLRFLFMAMALSFCSSLSS